MTAWLNSFLSARDKLAKELRKLSSLCACQCKWQFAQVSTTNMSLLCDKEMDGLAFLIAFWFCCGSASFYLDFDINLVIIIIKII